MIPKVIHYCWFGGEPLPDLAIMCIASWKKYCPDYEIVEWNESNFDVNCCDYVREAYEAKKWAFVSDYARFKILYDHGGLYFDVDVELVKPLDDIVSKGGFMGCEENADLATSMRVAPGLGIGVEPGHYLYKELLEAYHCRHFLNEDGSYNLRTIVSYTTQTLLEHGLQGGNEIQKIAGIYIYPRAYFCPKNYLTGELVMTEDTRAIHHFDGSWISDEEKCATALRNKLKKHLPKRMAAHLSTLTGILKYRGIGAAVKEIGNFLTGKR